MTWLAAKLNRRIDICKPIQTPDKEGGFATSYEILISVWCNIAPVKSNPLLSVIRGMQTNQNVTHILTVRECAVKVLKNREDTLNPIKSNYFLFLKEGDGGQSKGRRFAIRQVVDVEERREYYKIAVEELYEEGSGY